MTKSLTSRSDRRAQMGQQASGRKHVVRPGEGRSPDPLLPRQGAEALGHQVQVVGGDDQGYPGGLQGEGLAVDMWILGWEPPKEKSSTHLLR